jgi:hypothetical protein
MFLAQVAQTLMQRPIDAQTMVPRLISVIVPLMLKLAQDNCQPYGMTLSLSQNNALSIMPE